MMAVGAIVIGILLLGLVLEDAFEVLLLPRRVRRRWRIATAFFTATWSFWSALAGLFRREETRAAFLSIYGPVSVVLLFLTWSTTLIVGFGLIAVVIGYLPVLYQLFSRREAHVIQLDARAGSPPSACGMLRRHAESHGLGKIDELLRAWEIWGSELLESHLSYPMLAFYRSQHDDQSWLGAIAAIMDTCALILVGIEDIGPLQARMTFAMGRQVLVELVRALDLPAHAAEHSERLTGPEFAAMIEELKGAGLKWNGGPEAEEILAAARATYEPQLDALADYLLISVPRWAGDAETPDHWERGPRGIIARRLVEGLATGANDTAAEVAQRRRKKR